MRWFDFSDPVFLAISAVALFIIAQQLTSAKFLAYVKNRLEAKRVRHEKRVLARDRELLDFNTTTATEHQLQYTRQLWKIGNAGQIQLAQGLADVEFRRIEREHGLETNAARWLAQGEAGLHRAQDLVDLMDRLVDEIEGLKAKQPKTLAIREKLKNRQLALESHRKAYREQFGA